MRLNEIQSYIAGQISAVAELVAFGAPLTFSYADNEETVKAAITDRLSTAGVSIEVGLVSGADASLSSQGRYAALSAGFEVWVAESPTVTHAPANLDLVQKVIAAVVGRNPSNDFTPISTGFGSAVTEQGYILHVLNFTIPIRIV